MVEDSSLTQAQQLFEQGIAAVRAKQLAQGRQLLKESLALDAENDRAWLWYSKTLDDPEKQLKCVERALKINPDNATAQELKNRILTKLNRAESNIDFTNENVSPKATQLFEAKNLALGKPVFSSGIRWFYQLRKLTGFLTGFALSLIIFVVIDPFSNPNGVDYEIVAMGSFFAFVAILCLILLFFAPFGNQIIVYENGISYGNKKNPKIYRWSELDGITHPRNLTILQSSSSLSPFSDIGFYRINLYQKGKNVISITRDFANYDELGNIILDFAQAALVQHFAREWQQGRKVVLGNLTLDKRGLQSNSNLIVWDNILNVKSEGEYQLILETQKEKISISTRNSHIRAVVLVGLIRSINSAYTLKF